MNRFIELVCVKCSQFMRGCAKLLKGGCASLLARMEEEDEEDDEPVVDPEFWIALATVWLYTYHAIEDTGCVPFIVINYN